MRRSPKTLLVVLWALMSVFTGLSLFMTHSTRLGVEAVYALICSLTYLKCRFVIMNFMEIRDAPIGWRMFFEVWILGVTGMILFLKFVA